ncbi:CBM35 domain-containing protein [Gilvimarinus sp. 1_MG-2023]|uniref:CBM35 domain-containing protein n=1 Tax=Gilvimarinus sp. 1_MG-2023 TaxID=3062638 RepID=UPI0026E18DB3|nr:CBM35 domain-containing protein [Gilvimarinus sp. 1_MG-2023]MDO6746719.1 CBM35 domain-containing protein [Gilvimarinus sp. 1_MG-2023]
MIKIFDCHLFHVRFTGLAASFFAAALMTACGSDSDSSQSSVPDPDPATPVVMNEFYVSPTGDDTNAGTLEQPLQTLQAARDAVRAVNADMEEDIYVYLRGGHYPLTQPLELQSVDSGRNGYRVIYQAYEGEKPILNGATQVTGWSQHDGNIYKATLEHSSKLRTLIVNGERAYMASQSATSTGSWGTYTITEGQADWARISGSHPDGVTYSVSDVPEISRPADLEIMNQTKWNTNFVTVRETLVEDSNRVMKLSQPYASIAMNQNWGAFNTNGRHVLLNAYEFLDEPNEFYFDQSDNTLYYYSENIDMASAEVWAPLASELLNIKGESKESRAENIIFSGITFAYTEAVLPEVAGSSGKSTVQAATWKTAYSDGNWHNDKYTAYDVMRGAINVNHAGSISIENGTIKHIGNEGINFTNDVIDSQIIGNAIIDVGGSGINIAHPQHVYIGDGGEHEKYSSDNEGVVQNILVRNNLLYDTTRIYWGHAAITAFFTDGLHIEHNQIQNTKYSGVSLGWGWNNFAPETTPDNPTTVAQNNKFNNNRVYNVMTVLEDGGAFYTLGNQPNSEASGNYVKAPTTHFQGVYHPDEGTAWYTGTDLVFEIVPGQDNFELNAWRDKHSNHYSNIYTTSGSNRTGAPDSSITDMYVYPSADWPEEALNIIANAGLESDYLYLLDGIPEPPEVPGLTASASGNVLEAESATLLGGASIFNDEEASGGQAIENIHADGSGIEFSDVPHATALQLKYAATESGTYSVYVNDERKGEITFEATGSLSGSYEDSDSIYIDLPKGATLTLKKDAGDGALNIDYLLLVNQSFHQEAEDALLLGGAKVDTGHEGYSGSGFVGDILNIGDAVQFTVNVASTGQYILDTRYAMGLYGPEGDRSMSIYVGDTEQAHTYFVSTGEWNIWSNQQADAAIPLIAGANTLKLQYDEDDAGHINIDYIQLAPKIEVEDGTLNQAVANNNHEGFSGFGFVGDMVNVGDSVEIVLNVPTAGEYLLDIQYAMGPDGPSGDRTLSLYVNEVDQAQATFQGTEQWSSWAAVQQALILNAGRNVLRFQVDAEDTGWVNLDYIVVK